MSTLSNLSLCYSTEKSEMVIAEYVHIDGSGDLRSRARNVPGPVSDSSELPNWNYDGSLTGEAPAYDSQVILKPQAIFRDPFKGGNNILVMCDAYTPAGEPIPTNKRYAAAMIFSHPDVVAEEPWYGFHQEYTLLQKPVGGFPGPQWSYYCVAGDDKAFGRDIVNALYKNCLYAGINISGINGEMMAGQSVPAPASGISAGDQFWIARYILKRITEMLGVGLSFDPNPIPGYLEGAGARIIFSTKSMREVGCHEVSKIKLEKLRMKHKLDMAAYGEGRESLLPAETVLRALPYRGASLGAGSGTKGYIIVDGRPASNMDPYEVTSQIAKTTIIWKPTAYEILAAMIPFFCCMKRLFGRTCY